MTQDKDIREMTADTIGRDILQALVQEIKLLPDLWIKMTQKKQDDIINRLRARVEYNVRMAVHLIASENRTTIIGDLEQVTSKDGIKAQFKISSNSSGRHHLFDSVGKACLIVIADAEETVGGMEDIKGESDQRSMDLGKEYTDQDGDGMDRSGDDIVDAEIISIEHQPLQVELQQAWDDGYTAAEEGKPESDCPVMAGPLRIEWVKGWKTWHEERGTQSEDADTTTEGA
ncbi:ribosome modulation factor [Neopusillimonas aromaticivorans]|uniref:ribosome modulation factor n=1 Tax=Neopusillimonas aromaticivorans TaxID=2979868 RepID=UPI00259953C8|nr:Rmf/CrpP family protein [Neopusillimonas aromaticivorans]WJJ94033.1 cell division protein FtsK [Neopusillimonas aromaticivorans]